MISASHLYDFVQCPHRVTMDRVGSPAERDPVSRFVELLWERGSNYERDVVDSLSKTERVLDLSEFKDDEQERRTLAALSEGVPVIYSGRLRADDLEGRPDLLRREGGGYIAIDIKSGRGEEGGDDETDGKPKRHYGAQLALYTDILERLGYSADRRGIILAIRNEEVVYDLTRPRGPRIRKSQWDEYVEVLGKTRNVLTGKSPTRPAYAAACKLCHWHSACLRALRNSDDLTLIPRLGRNARDAMVDTIPTIQALSKINPDDYTRPKHKTPFSGVGAASLRAFHERAKLLSRPGAQPYLKRSLTFPTAPTEVFFDIETDPMRDICYLHGFLIRRDGNTAEERFVGIFADDATITAERAAFAEAIDLFRAAQPCIVYYYSKYERTWFRKLQARYPDVCSIEEIETLFDVNHAVDLYDDVVLRVTEWPTNDYSIKTLAKFLGFHWRDENPSGAASIEWFGRWGEFRDQSMKQRILDYNEDDCRATRVLRDGIQTLHPQSKLVALAE